MYHDHKKQPSGASVMALLTLSSNMDGFLTYTDFDDSGLEEKVGAGLLDVSEAMSKVYSGESIFVTNGVQDQYVYSESIHFNNSGSIDFALAELEFLIESENGYTSAGSPRYRIDIFDSDNSLIMSSPFSEGNILKFSCVIPSAGTYYIRVYADGEVEYYFGMLYFVKDKHTDPMSPGTC